MDAKRKTVRSTAAQLKLLVDYMSTNPLFAAGEFSGPLGAQRLEAEWASLAKTLGEVGPTKTTTQWKHTWRDLRKKTRDEGGRARLALQATGNIITVPEISEKSRKILDTIGHESATGIGSEEETGFGNISFIPPPAEFAKVLEEPEAQPPQPSTSKTPPLPKRRRLVAAPSIAAQFVSVQKDTNKLLQGLQKELSESNELRRAQLSLLERITKNLETRCEK